VLQRFFQNYQQLQGKQVQVQDSKLDQAAVNVIARALTSYNALREQLREEHHGSGGS
jgi:inorganic pyrophosphatase